jgi:hypothetical protein
MLRDPVKETLCGAFKNAHRWEAASTRRERHHQALALALGYIAPGPRNTFILTELGREKCRRVSESEGLN